ncbi:hypothetical protein G8S49_03875 [Clostridium botulinum C]|uniref:Nal1 N-terminal domain-containing protein n=1 Tax=Clostridium botulinum C TaxID=36828 RepID=A0A9Q3YXS4_CLOBO|nr:MULTISPECIES: hypothetical protein [Clostridium]MCD3193767.1 hypothetical protein [Clostridium botulinum C]MCD3199835.1 hypothetical protein [Clostridium botulinum C]MCD3205310.1 hypothetical protein [Clostridium botulinum C]MCD3207236.1 hypothetical protein [Clostridium botulinum C]MCD3224638.1 hypothetical protein [Clostridium botulinum C]
MSFNNNYYKQSKIEKLIRHVCNDEYEYFLNKKNVVGIGLGYKMKKGFYTSQLCIQVYVTRKLTRNIINSQNLVPDMYKGILTDVIETGIFKSNSLTGKVRPTLGGYIIGNEYKLDSGGTLGCLVTDGKDLFILSNNHVLASNNAAPIGTKIIQPSYDDGGSLKTDVVAILSKFVPKKPMETFRNPTNYADCAIAKIINKSLASPKIALVGLPQEPIIAKLNQSVKKVGAVTELTTGIIIGINVTAKMNSFSTGKTFLFKNQIATSSMSDGGDSGALLLDDNNHVLGLLLGGGKIRTVYNPINYILKELNVRLVTSRNVDKFF